MGLLDPLHSIPIFEPHRHGQASEAGTTLCGAADRAAPERFLHSELECFENVGELASR